MTLIKVLDLKMSQFQKKHVSCQEKQMAAEFFKNSDQNFDQISRWLQLIHIYDIKKGARPEDVPIKKKQMSCLKKQMAAEFFKNSNQNFGQKSRWLQLISMTLI